MFAIVMPPLLDLLPPGHRAVVHELVVEPSEPLEHWTLIASGARLTGPVQIPVTPGEPFAFSAKNDTRLFAVPAGEPLPASLTPEWLAAHASAAPPVDSVDSVPYLWPTESIVSRIRVDHVDAHTLALSLVSEHTAHNTPLVAMWVTFAVLAVGGVAGLVRLRMRARRKNGPGCSRC